MTVPEIRTDFFQQYYDFDSRGFKSYPRGFFLIVFPLNFPNQVGLHNDSAVSCRTGDLKVLASILTRSTELIVGRGVSLGKELQGI